MSLLDRLRGWWASLLGRDGASDTPEEAPDGPPDTATTADAATPPDAGTPTERATADLPLRCDICGTPAAADAEQCSLCQSTELVPAGDGPAADNGSAAAVVDEDEPDTAVRDGRETEDAASRLSQLRDQEGNDTGDRSGEGGGGSSGDGSAT